MVVTYKVEGVLKLGASTFKKGWELIKLLFPYFVLFRLA